MPRPSPWHSRSPHRLVTRQRAGHACAVVVRPRGADAAAAHASSRAGARSRPAPGAWPIAGPGGRRPGARHGGAHHPDPSRGAVAWRLVRPCTTRTSPSGHGRRRHGRTSKPPTRWVSTGSWETTCRSWSRPRAAEPRFVRWRHRRGSARRGRRASCTGRGRDARREHGLGRQARQDGDRRDAVDHADQDILEAVAAGRARSGSRP